MRKFIGNRFIISMLAVVFPVIFSGCQPESTNGSDSHLLGRIAGRALAEREVTRVITNAGFPRASIKKMVCTAWYESNWHTGSYNRNSNGSTDFGLLQINSVHWRGCGVSRTSLADPNVNARCGLRVFRSQGIRAWYGYRSHRRKCDAYAGGRIGLSVEDQSLDEEILSGDGSDLDGVVDDMDMNDMNNGKDMPSNSED